MSHHLLMSTVGELSLNHRFMQFALEIAADSKKGDERSVLATFFDSISFSVPENEKLLEKSRNKLEKALVSIKRANNVLSGFYEDDFPLFEYPCSLYDIFLNNSDLYCRVTQSLDENDAISSQLMNELTLYNVCKKCC